MGSEEPGHYSSEAAPPKNLLWGASWLFVVVFASVGSCVCVCVGGLQAFSPLAPEASPVSKFDEGPLPPF